MKVITIHASGYSAANDGMQEIKSAADADFVLAKEADGSTEKGKAFKERKTEEGRTGYDSLRRFWANHLDFCLANIPRPKEHNPVVGMFANELEPSSQVTIGFESEQDWSEHEAAVKESLIQFGIRFKQSTVHIVDLYATKPRSRQYGEVIGDVTFQKKLWVFFNLPEMGSYRTFDNFQVLKEVADNAGISDLTTDIYGRFSLLIYSVGRDGYLTFDEKSRNLIIGLANRNLIGQINRVEDVALTNYGASEFGATHSLEQAKEYLELLRNRPIK